MLKMLKRKRTRGHGPEDWTLIESLVVVAIVAILAAILFPLFVSARTATRVKLAEQALPAAWWMMDDVSTPSTVGRLTVRSLPLSSSRYPDGWLVLAEERGRVVAYVESPADLSAARRKLLIELHRNSATYQEFQGRLGITPPAD